MIDLITRNVFIILLSLGLLSGISVTMYQIGDKRRAKRSIFQSARWVFVGIIVAVAAESYQEAPLFGSQFSVVIIFMIVLMIIEYYLLKLEDDVEVQSKERK